MKAAAIEPPEADQPKRTAAKKRIRRVRLGLWELFEATEGPREWFVALAAANVKSGLAAIKGSGSESYTTPQKHTGRGHERLGAGVRYARAPADISKKPRSHDSASTRSVAAASPSGTDSLPPKPDIGVSPAKLAALLQAARDANQS